MTWEVPRLWGAGENPDRDRSAEEFSRWRVPPSAVPGPLTQDERRQIVDAAARYYRLSGWRWHGRVLWIGSPAAFAARVTEESDLRSLPLGARVRSRWRQMVILRAQLVPLVQQTLLVVGAFTLPVVVIVMIVAGRGRIPAPSWIALPLLAGGGLGALLVLVAANASMPPQMMIEDQVRDLVAGLATAARTRSVTAFAPRRRLRSVVPRGTTALVPPGGLGRQESMGAEGILPSELASTTSIMFGPAYALLAAADLEWCVLNVHEIGPWKRRHLTSVTVPELQWLLARREVRPASRGSELLDAVVALTRRPFACAFFHSSLVVLEPPSVVRTESLPDGRRRLHADDGPALAWPSGEEYWFAHGDPVAAQQEGQWGSRRRP